MMPLSITLHLLAAVIWVGGMFFAWTILRPVAATLLEPPLRLPLWAKVFGRFFPWVWASVLVLPLTGYWLIFQRFGGLSEAPLYTHLMQAGGWLMILIFLHVFFAPYSRLRDAVARADFATAGKHLAQIRRLVGINTMIGILTVAIAAGGRYLI
jgi:uncharacterized membrane protein